MHTCIREVYVNASRCTRRNRSEPGHASIIKSKGGFVPENGGSEILCRSFLVARRHLDSSSDSYSSLLNDLARHAGRITVPLPPSSIRIPEDPFFIWPPLDSTIRLKLGSQPRIYNYR